MKHCTREEAEAIAQHEWRTDWYGKVPTEGRSYVTAYGNIRPIPRAFRDPIEVDYDMVAEYWKTRKPMPEGKVKRVTAELVKAVNELKWTVKHESWKTNFVLIDPNGLVYVCYDKIFPYMIRYKKVHPKNKKQEKK